MRTKSLVLPEKAMREELSEEEKEARKAREKGHVRWQVDPETKDMIEIPLDKNNDPFYRDDGVFQQAKRKQPVMPKRRD